MGTEEYRIYLEAVLILPVQILVYVKILVQGVIQNCRIARIGPLILVITGNCWVELG